MNAVQQKTGTRGKMQMNNNNQSVNQVLDSLPALVFFTDADGRILWGNKSFTGLFGDIGSSGTGTSIEKLFPEDKEGFLSDIRRTISSGEAASRIIRKIDTRHGGPKTLSFSIAPCTTSGRARFVWCAWDITDQIELERLKRDAYDQIEKNIEQFAVLGDHLRNPVAVIIGFCDLLEDRTIAQKIIAQAQEIDRIVTRIDQGWIDSEKVRAVIKKYYDVGVSGTHELVARAIHEEYIEQQQNAGMNADTNPSMRPWNELSRHLQDANLKQADDIWKKLLSIHCAIGISITPDEPLFEFMPDEIEALAPMEHDRWMNEKVSMGWKYGQDTDERKRIHHCIVPWDQLTEEQREKDRNAVRSLPRVLAKVRLKIIRYG
jgi:PAS domain S-box-containing protein